MEIQVTNLVQTYGKTRALDGVSLHIPGGMFGLLGPNGAGKTTLMRLLTTQLPPTAGEIRIGGIDVVREPARLRPHLGYLPQDFGFYRGLNAYETLAYIAELKNVPAPDRRRQIEAALTEVNLTADARRRVQGFSGGMKQRLGIAQALLGNPRVLIVDEPTAGLDPEERERALALIHRPVPGRVVLLSSHVPSEVEAVARHVLVLRAGRVLFAGTGAELLQVAAGRVFAVTVPAAAVAGCLQRWTVSRVAQQGERAVLRIVGAPPAGVAAEPVAGSLEDAYLLLQRTQGI